jgi:hypothetical protein
LRVFERSLLIKKRLHYKSITVLSFYLLPLLFKVAAQFPFLTDYLLVSKKRP